MINRRKRDGRTGRNAIAGALVLVLAASFQLTAAQALSDLKEVAPPAAEEAPKDTRPPLDEPLTGSDGGLPAPAPIIRPQPEPTPAVTEPADAADAAPVEILTDPTQLPEPARRMRELIIEAASSGEIENLRALLGSGPTATQLALSDIDSDPVDYLRSISGDGAGQEILAILIDLLNTGFVRVDADEPGETYLWPYFAAMPLDSLTPPQQVELLRLVTAGDVEDMKAYGAYNFYRVGISPEGEWRFFMAGD
ncbi:hypothetical protein [Hoeflea olei]|uniref:Uncharacterized protein n=1 Tax=Hoeflea olei TaxID=1480615 RepID=A0A1C1YW60_9HYPH|nr:hypothetical protein [Hoeflea olei]OCW57717.1 hypothetical protein AWJ14_02620 [Hoeflea olei]